MSKLFNYWTKERVDNGLRRFARDLFNGREKHLPKCYSTYLEAIPENMRRLNRQLRLYPPPARVLLQYSSFVEAWQSLGFVLEYRRSENWTRDNAIYGLKRIYGSVGYCLTDYRQYHEFVTAEKSETKYPSLLTILDLFSSLETAWLSAGFNVETPRKRILPEDDEFIAELVKKEDIGISELQKTSPLNQIIKRIFMRHIIRIITDRAERLRREKIEAFKPKTKKPKPKKTTPVKVVKKVHFDKDGQAICRQNSKTERFNIELTDIKSAVTCQSCLDILDGKIVLCRFRLKEELPAKAYCQQCETEKPITEMMVAFLRKEKLYRIRPRCKDCYNKNERGHRRGWKKEYLQNWRKNNADKNESYWKDNPKVKEKSRLRTNKIWNEKREAVLIQGRMNRHGSRVSLKKAEELLKKFGRCYPMRDGLTAEGLRECEKIRSRFRLRKEKPLKSFDIRLMVYADDNGSYRFVIPPENQPTPYIKASENMKKWHEQRSN